jgi:hypothetical protein
MVKRITIFPGAIIIYSLILILLSAWSGGTFYKFDFFSFQWILLAYLIEIL